MVSPDAYPSVTGEPKKRKRLRNSPTSLASRQLLPPSTVALVNPLVKPPGPQPPTQPRFASMNPIPSRLVLPWASLIFSRVLVLPPSVVFRIAPASKFSKETKPRSLRRNWIFQPHSPNGKFACWPASRSDPVRTAVEGLQHHGLE